MKPPRLLRTVYLRAIEVLKKRGWCQGGLADGADGPCCMVGACNVVRCGSPYGGPGAIGIDEIEEAIGTPLYGIWNDDPGRTLGQVIAALRKAAKLAGNRRLVS